MTLLVDGGPRIPRKSTTRSVVDDLDASGSSLVITWFKWMYNCLKWMKWTKCNRGFGIEDVQLCHIVSYLRITAKRPSNLVILLILRT